MGVVLNRDERPVCIGVHVYDASLGSASVSELFVYTLEKAHGLTVSPVTTEALSSLPADRLVLASIQFLMKLSDGGFR